MSAGIISLVANKQRRKLCVAVAAAHFPLYSRSRRGGGGRRNPVTSVTGVPTILALGIVLNIIGLGFFCWVLFTLAIFALPFFIGMSVGLYAHNSGVGPLGAFGFGIVAAAFVLVIGQTIFTFVRTPILRIAVALMFAVPAALAGYYATFGLSGLAMTSDLWRQVFAVIGAVVIGTTAWARLAASPPNGPDGPGRPALS